MGSTFVTCVRGAGAVESTRVPTTRVGGCDPEHYPCRRSLQCALYGLNAGSRCTSARAQKAVRCNGLDRRFRPKLWNRPPLRTSPPTKSSKTGLARGRRSSFSTTSSPTGPTRSARRSRRSTRTSRRSQGSEAHRGKARHAAAMRFSLAVDAAGSLTVTATPRVPSLGSTTW